MPFLGSNWRDWGSGFGSQASLLDLGSHVCRKSLALLAPDADLSN